MNRTYINFPFTTIIKGFLTVCLLILSLTSFSTLHVSANTNTAFKYNSKVPLPKAHQEYLYNLCKQRGLSYRSALAIIKIESNFHANARNNESYGYFQIAKVNHKSLAKTLHTANKPTDPYINIKWGTYMLSSLQKKYKAKGYRGVKLTEAILSAYNKGVGGYERTGKATSYIAKYNKALKVVNSWF
ncbi:transglycosylase SLT domain-containing protein [Bacillus sp. JJ664]